MSRLLRHALPLSLCLPLILCVLCQAQDSNNRSVSILQSAAEAGNPDVQAKMGQVLLLGTGITKDPAKGFQWSYEAALAGSSLGARMVGYAYSFGVGVGQNRQAAFEWLWIAALRGDGVSQRLVVSFYRDGKYAGKDLTIAYAWVLIRKAAGDKRMATVAASLEASILADQKTEAVALADAWARNKDHIMPFHSKWYFEHSAESEMLQPEHQPISKPTTSCSPGHWVISNLDGGKYIKLEDGSLWEIDDVDTVDSGLWLEADEITICSGKLINADDNTSAGARRVH